MGKGDDFNAELFESKSGGYAIFLLSLSYTTCTRLQCLISVKRKKRKPLDGLYLILSIFRNEIANSVVIIKKPVRQTDKR